MSELENNIRLLQELINKLSHINRELKYILKIKGEQK